MRVMRSGRDEGFGVRVSDVENFTRSLPMFASTTSRRARHSLPVAAAPDRASGALCLVLGGIRERHVSSFPRLSRRVTS